MSHRILIVGSRTELLSHTAIAILIAQAHCLVADEFPEGPIELARPKPPEITKEMLESIDCKKQQEQELESSNCPPSQWGQRRHRRPR